MLCVCVFPFDLGMFCTKKQTHGQLSGARQNFHTESDVFYGDLVKFSLYFFLHVTMYTRRDRQALLPLELILPAIDLVFKSNSSVLVQTGRKFCPPPTRTLGGILKVSYPQTWFK